MDCDEQHEPAAIPRFIDAIEAGRADVISGSRYLSLADSGDAPPEDRRAINKVITEEINCRLGLSLTDSFCGFKAYRVAACERLSLDVDGYDFPMQFWVQAVAHGLRITEIPVRLIYNDPNRSFGGPLDDPQTRLTHYRRTLKREMRRCAERLPRSAGCSERLIACADESA
jgi:dolichol-phosphate mannosyltransferase